MTAARVTATTQHVAPTARFLGSMTRLDSTRLCPGMSAEALSLSSVPLIELLWSVVLIRQNVRSESTTLLPGHVPYARASGLGRVGLHCSTFFQLSGPDPFLDRLSSAVALPFLHKGSERTHTSRHHLTCLSGLSFHPDLPIFSIPRARHK